MYTETYIEIMNKYHKIYIIRFGIDNKEFINYLFSTEILKDARLDPDTIFNAVQKFALDREDRIKRQTAYLGE